MRLCPWRTCLPWHDYAFNFERRRCGHPHCLSTPLSADVTWFLSHVCLLIPIVKKIFKLIISKQPIICEYKKNIWIKKVAARWLTLVGWSLSPFLSGCDSLTCCKAFKKGSLLTFWECRPLPCVSAPRLPSCNRPRIPVYLINIRFVSYWPCESSNLWELDIRLLCAREVP